MNLRLAKHHRVEAAGDAEEMRDRLLVATHVAVSGRIRRRAAADSADQIAGPASVSSSTM